MRLWPFGSQLGGCSPATCLAVMQCLQGNPGWKTHRPPLSLALHCRERQHCRQHCCHRCAADAPRTHCANEVLGHRNVLGVRVSLMSEVGAIYSWTTSPIGACAISSGCKGHLPRGTKCGRFRGACATTPPAPGQPFSPHAGPHSSLSLCHLQVQRRSLSLRHLTWCHLQAQRTSDRNGNTSHSLLSAAWPR